MWRFGCVIVAAVFAVSCGSDAAPSMEQIKNDFARIDPGCASYSVDRVERMGESVWVTVATPCNRDKDDGRMMQLKYEQRNGRWVVAFYAPVLDD